MPYKTDHEKCWSIAVRIEPIETKFKKKYDVAIRSGSVQRCDEGPRIMTARSWVVFAPT